MAEDDDDGQEEPQQPDDDRGGATGAAGTHEPGDHEAQDGEHDEHETGDVIDHGVLLPLWRPMEERRRSRAHSEEFEHHPRRSGAANCLG